MAVRVSDVKLKSTKYEERLYRIPLYSSKTKPLFLNESGLFYLRKLIVIFF